MTVLTLLTVQQRFQRFFAVPGDNTYREGFNGANGPYGDCVVKVGINGFIYRFSEYFPNQKIDGTGESRVAIAA
jgi:hypothetical protein